MISLRERAEKIYVELYSYKHPKQDERMIRIFEAALLAVREEAIEEAASLCERYIDKDGHNVAHFCAKEIRALKHTGEKPCYCKNGIRGRFCLDFHVKEYVIK